VNWDEAELALGRSSEALTRPLYAPPEVSRHPLEVLDHRFYIGRRNAELARDLGLVAVRGQET
jgi:hypothetical protein